MYLSVIIIMSLLVSGLKAFAGPKAVRGAFSHLHVRPVSSARGKF